MTDKEKIELLGYAVIYLAKALRELVVDEKSEIFINLEEIILEIGENVCEIKDKDC